MKELENLQLGELNAEFQIWEEKAHYPISFGGKQVIPHSLGMFGCELQSQKISKIFLVNVEDENSCAE